MTQNRSTAEIKDDVASLLEKGNHNLYMGDYNKAYQQFCDASDLVETNPSNYLPHIAVTLRDCSAKAYLLGLAKHGDTGQTIEGFFNDFFQDKSPEEQIRFIDTTSGAYGVKALILAAGSNHTDVVQSLIDRKATLSVVNDYGDTALHAAARNNDVGMIRLLRSAGARDQAVNKDDFTPLLVAYCAPERNQDAIAELEGVESKRIEAGDAHPIPQPKQPAIKEKSNVTKDTVKTVVSKSKQVYLEGKSFFDKADYVNAIKKLAESWRMWICEQFPEVVPFVTHKEKLNAWIVNNNLKLLVAGTTPEKILFIRILIHLTLSNNIQYGDNTEVTQEKQSLTKAFPSPKDSIKEITALIHLLNEKNLIDQLLVELTQLQQRVDFWESLRNKDLETLKQLSAKQPTLNKAKYGATTPLMLAVKENFLEGVVHLLKTGANTEDQDRTGHTALHYAVYLKHTRIIQILTQHHANIFAVNSANQTPYEMATMMGEYPVIKCFLISIIGLQNELASAVSLKPKEVTAIVKLIKQHTFDPKTITQKAHQILGHYKNDPSHKPVTEEKPGGLDWDEEDHPPKVTSQPKVKVAQNQLGCEEYYYQAEEKWNCQQVQSAVEDYQQALTLWSRQHAVELEKLKKHTINKSKQSLPKLNPQHLTEYNWYLNILIKLEEAHRFQGDYTNALFYAKEIQSIQLLLNNLQLSVPAMKQTLISPVSVQLLIAVQNGDLQRVKGIISANASLCNLTCKEGDSIYKMALLANTKNHTDILYYLFTLSSPVMMTPDNQGKSLLHHAAVLGRTDIISYFTRGLGQQHFIALNCKDIKGRLPLEDAQTAKQDDVAELLQEKINQLMESKEALSRPKIHVRKVSNDPENLIRQTRECLVQFKKPQSESSYHELLAKSELLAIQLAHQLRDNEKNRLCRLFLIRLYTKMHRYKEAKALLLIHLKVNPNDSNYRLQLAAILNKMGEEIEAEHEYDTICAKSKAPEVLQETLYFYRKNKKYEKLSHVFNRVLAVQPFNREAMIGKAVWAEKNDKRIARSCYLALIKHHGDNPAALEEAAWFFIRNGQLTKAEKLWRSPTFDSHQKKRILGLAKIEALRGNDAGAIYKQCLDKFPQEENVLFAYAQFIKRKNRSECIKFLEKIVLINPYFQKAHIELIACHCAKGDYVSALLVHAKAVELFPNNANLALIKGYLDTNQLEEAINKCELCLKSVSKPMAIPFYVLLIKAHLLNHNQEIAIQLCHTFINDYPKALHEIQALASLFSQAGIQIKTSALSTPTSTPPVTSENKSDTPALSTKTSRLPSAAVPYLKAIEATGSTGYVLGGAYVKAFYGVTSNHEDDIDIPHSLSIQGFYQLMTNVPDRFQDTIQCSYAGYERLFQNRQPGIKFDFWCNEVIAVNPIHDAHQRDFTMNTVGVKLNGDEIDPTGWGKLDLEAKVLRVVTDDLTPENKRGTQSQEKIDNRFKEDPIRLLRGMHFIVQYGVSVEPTTEASMHKQILSLKDVKIDRLNDAYRKFFTTGHAHAFFKQLQRFKALPVLFPSMETPDWGWVSGQLKIFDQYIAGFPKGSMNLREEIKYVYSIFITDALYRGKQPVTSENILSIIKAYRFVLYDEADELIANIQILMRARTSYDKQMKTSSPSAASQALFFQNASKQHKKKTSNTLRQQKTLAL